MRGVRHRVRGFVATLLASGLAVGGASAAPARLTPPLRTAVEAWCGRPLGERGPGGAPESFEVLEVNVHGGTTHVLLGRRWDGLRVVPERVRLSFGPDDRLRLAAGTFTPLPTGLAPARLAAAEAAATAGAALARAGASAPAFEAVVHASPAGARRAWRVAFAGAEPLARAAGYVDANSGLWLGEESPPVPAVCYAHDPDPRSGLVERPLPWLVGDGSRLVTPWLRVEGPRLRRLERADGDFRILPTDPDTTDFDQANAAWNVGRFLHEFLARLGYEGPPETLVVRVQQELAPYPALTSGRYILLGQPVPGFTWDAAKATDLTLHEAQHAVVMGFGIEGAGERREANSLHEGLADYMAAAATSDPAIGEWLYRPYPAGATRVDRPAEEFRYENYDRVRYAAATLGSSWANGMILSGALWDLRGAVGTAADSLVLEALPFLSPRPMWGELANALLAADAAFHAGRLRSDVRAALIGRGIHGSLILQVDGPAELRPNEPGTFRVAVTGLREGGYAWAVRRAASGGVRGEWEMLAGTDSVSVASAEDFEVRVRCGGAWGDTAEAAHYVAVGAAGVTIEGPWIVSPGRPASFRAVPRGVPPFAISWLVSNGSLWSPLGTGDVVTLARTSTYQLLAHVTDARGRTAFTTTRVRPLRIALSGPVRAAPGATVTCTAALDTLVEGAEMTWWLRRWCEGEPCGPVVEAVGHGLRASVACEEDMRLTFAVSLPGGGSCAESLFVTRHGPELVVDGPFEQPGGVRFDGRVGGVAAAGVYWYVRGPGATAESFLGSGASVLVSIAPPFFVRARFVDALGRVADTTVTYAGRVVSTDRAAPFALTVAATGRSVEARFTAPYAGAACLEVLDVAGRRVARPWAGVLGPEGCTVRWEARGRAHGVYFLRLAWAGQERIRRVALVP